MVRWLDKTDVLTEGHMHVLGRMGPDGSDWSRWVRLGQMGRVDGEVKITDGIIR